MGANSEYYVGLRREAALFVSDLLTAAVDRFTDTKQAHEELLGRPEKALHERQIAFYTEVVSLLRTAAKSVHAEPTTAVAEILDGAYSDRMALANPVEEATP